MFRNVESKFASVPQVDIERSTFDRPSELKTSFNFADLIPIYAEEILPGDTVKMTTSKVVRMQTLITPVLDNAFLDVFWFFVPNRLVWTSWKKFMGETVYPDGAWVQTTQYTVPSIISPVGGFQKGTLADYFGLPIGLDWTSTDQFRPMALPFRCYSLIVNEFFRDENLSAPLAINTGDSNNIGTNGSNYITDVDNGGKPFKVAKIHDMFTSCLPAPQRSASPVSFPLISGTMAPVRTTKDLVEYPTNQGVWNASPLVQTGSNNPSSINFHRVAVSSNNLVVSSSGQDFATASAYSNSGFTPANLWADLSTTVGAVTVNELRLSFQLQRFYEKSARSGSRYTELLRSFFGVTSPDSRLQRPEYLGGNRIPININEVTNSAQSSGEPLGDLGAKSATSDVNYDFEHSFTEHGWLIGLMCARTDHTYSQGIDQKWLRKTTFDYYFTTFAHVGEMPIYDVSIYADSTSINTPNVFGYNEAWIEYRAKNNKATGEMRTSASGLGLGDVWTFGDYYAAQPTLSDSWIREDPANVDRTLAVQMANADQLFADIYFDSTWTRPMPLYSVPGLIDHF